MAIYPFPEKVHLATRGMTAGNFGLWYNKFVPLSENFKAANDRGNDTEAVSYYFDRYNQMKRSAFDLLRKKHQDQSAYCESFPQSDYEVITIRATLRTPLITGIGESHPHEVSMVFEHNLGIPYIPASGVKGIVRFAHTLSIFLDETGTVKEEYNNQDFIEESETDLPDIFGGIKAKGKEKEILRGRVIFLDTYPEKVPDLHVDIMNPHYGKYYSGESPPADYLDPNPLKFLTVAKDTVFIFRALVNKEPPELVEKVKTAFVKALTEEGVGAKTAVGYGLFDICETKEETVAVKINTQSKVEIKPVDKFISAIRALKANNAGPINSKIDEALKKLELEEEKKIFAQAVKSHMNKSFRKSKAEAKLAQFLG